MEFFAQTTVGGCGACSFIMVARHFDRACDMTESSALERFGVSGFGPRCFALVPSFQAASGAVGLHTRIKSLTRADLIRHLYDGPVIVYHRASDAPDAVHHFSVAIAANEDEIVRHDPAVGPSVTETWSQFEALWGHATVSWWPYCGNYAALIRPAFDD